MSGLKWRWGESNSRPDKRLQQRLHAYFSFKVFVLSAAGKQGHLEAYPSVLSHLSNLRARSINQSNK